MNYINVKPGSIPGVEVRDGRAYYEVSGIFFPITAFVTDPVRGLIPLLDIPQMSDERCQELARERRTSAEETA